MVAELFELYWQRIDGSPSVKKCAEKREYNLNMLVNDMNALGNKGESDEICSRFLKQLLPAGHNVHDPNTAIKAFADLAPLYCSTNERPAVCVYREGDKELPVLPVEVHSSSYEHTIRKCILIVSHLFRLYRMYDPNYEKCVGFSFPKLRDAQCGKKQSGKGGFKYRLKCLSADAVSSTVCQAIRDIKSPCDWNSPSCACSFLEECANPTLR